MIFKYFRRIDWILIAVTVVLVYFQVLLELEIPGYMSKITLIMTTGGTADDVLSEGIPMLACAFGSLLTAIVAVGISAYVGTNLGKTLRQRQFDQVEKYSEEEINKFSIYSLITRSTNDVVQIQNAFIIGLMIFIRAPLMAVMALMKISTKNIEWTTATVVAVIAVVACILIIMWYTFSRFKKIQWLNDDVNRVTKESLTGLRVVHAYNAESFQEARFKEANKKLTDTHLEITRALAFMPATMTAVMSILGLSIYWIGAIIIDSTMGPERLIQFSDMIVFSSYAMQVIMSFMMLIIVFMVLPRATVASKRIQEVIDTEPTITDGPSSVDSDAGEIEFRNVSFTYPGGSDHTIRDISFKIAKGETLAIIGSTGSGKSTLVKLIPRFYDVTEGEVLVDGVDVRQYDLDSLHRKVGYVPQKPLMFNDTIAANINYGDTESERTEEDIKKAADIAQASEFISRTEKGFDTTVTEGGTNLSGGQKQRVSIARAVCRKPEFYIFDDSFSALDYKTDRELRSRLRSETKDVTTIIVAQRIGTIMDADKILVLDDGRMAGLGKHDELLKDCEVYRQIALSQFTEEELVR